MGGALPQPLVQAQTPLATLVQTGKIRDFPLVLLGSDFWQPLVDFVDTLVRAGTVDAADAARIRLTDSVEEAVTMVTATALEQFGLTYGPRLRPRWVLGEVFRRAPSAHGMQP